MYQSTLNESDHGLVVSSLHFKIKPKRRQARTLHYETINVPSSCKASYQSVLSKTLNNSDQSSLVNSLSSHLSIRPVNCYLYHNNTVILTGSLTKSATSPGKNKKPGSVSKTHILKTSLDSRLSTIISKSSPKLQLKLGTLGGASGTEGAEHQALDAEQQGRGGSLIKDLRLLQKKFSKPASSTLVAKDGTTLQSEEDKLNHWAEHFEEMVNCQVVIDVVPLEDLPNASLLDASSDTSLSDEDLSTPLSEEEIQTAISELRSKKAPSLDGITLEMLTLGGDETVRWLKPSLTPLKDAQ